MKKLFYLSLICVLLVSISTIAGNFRNDNNLPAYEDDDDIMKVINTMFDGMRKGDSAMVSSVFSRGVNMASIMIRDGVSLMHEGSLDKFLNAVGTPHDQIWDERIWDPIVQVDGNMASVWVNYAFYLGDNFSHCGVNAFQLFKSDKGWKVINITDTRRKKQCNEPK